MPKEVSFYVPCFNAEKTVGACLEAVLRQTYPLKEVVVVDDASTDLTLEIVARYPVKVVRHGENRGLAAARNTALERLSSEFIASVDADCVPEPGWLEALMRMFASEKVAGAGGRLEEAQVASVFDAWRKAHMRQHWGQKRVSPPFLFGSNTVFRRKALQKAGAYNEALRNNYEDVDMSRRLAALGYRIVYEPAAVAAHFKSDDIYSLFNTYWRWHVAYYREEKFYEKKERFIAKLKENFGLANRYLEEDLAASRQALLYLDFLLAFHHSLRDLGYFLYKDEEACFLYPLATGWLAFLDLDFFAHFDRRKKELSTLLPPSGAFLQNLFALHLVAGKMLQRAFGPGFVRGYYRHVLFSACRIKDESLVDAVMGVAATGGDAGDFAWEELCAKKHPHLMEEFLAHSLRNLEAWLAQISVRFRGITQSLQSSAHAVEEFV